jgi:hypothetical protein
VSRRVLEILTYLARNHSSVANLLLYLEPIVQPAPASAEVSPQKVKEKGKAKVVEIPADAPEKSKVKGESPLILLLKLLNQPLYSRSSAHLEQVCSQNDLNIYVHFYIYSSCGTLSQILAVHLNCYCRSWDCLKLLQVMLEQKQI